MFEGFGMHNLANVIYMRNYRTMGRSDLDRKFMEDFGLGLFFLLNCGASHHPMKKKVGINTCVHYKKYNHCIHKT